MQIYSNYNIYQNQRTFHGHSRKLQTGLDIFLSKKEHSPADILQIKEMIKNIIGTTFVPEKFIGEGSRNAVFKITKKYAARVPIGIEITKDTLGDELLIGKQIFQRVTSYFGEPLLELSPIQILRNLGKHATVGVPEHIAKTLSKSKINWYYVHRYLPKFANLPQSAYDQLAQSIAELNNIKIDGYKYCEFDSINPNNIILKKGHLYLVDEIMTDCEHPFANTTAKLLQVFINKANMSTLAPCDDRGIKHTRKIFKKVVLASSGADVPHAETKEDYKNWQIALKRCGIKDEAYTVINALDDIDRTYSDLLVRKMKAQIFLNKLFLANPV